MYTPLPQALQDAVLLNPVIAEVLGRWKELALPDCWIVAGVIVQSYWNAAHKFPPLHGISDVDLIYFNPADLSEASESREARRISERFAHLDIDFDVKNEARVHLWYERKFGYPIAPYTSAESAIDTFPTTAGSVGIRPAGDVIDSYASFGYEDLLNLVVRPNKRQVTREIYTQKAARWRDLWPLLKIVDWDDAETSVANDNASSRSP